MRYKEDAKRKNGGKLADWGDSRSSAMSPFDRAHTPSHSPFIESCTGTSISCRFREIASYFRKLQIVPTQRALSAPIGGITPTENSPSELHQDLWYQKTRVTGLSCCVICAVCAIQRFAILVEL